jgi:hypothetical protein
MVSFPTCDHYSYSLFNINQAFDFGDTIRFKQYGMDGSIVLVSLIGPAVGEVVAEISGCTLGRVSLTIYRWHWLSAEGDGHHRYESDKCDSCRSETVGGVTKIRWTGGNANRPARIAILIVRHVTASAGRRDGAASDNRIEGSVAIGRPKWIPLIAYATQKLCCETEKMLQHPIHNIFTAALTNGKCLFT